MDEQRSALDSLMGINRNACGKERERRSGESFKDSKVCKCFLLGLCPNELFKNTKRELGPCPYLHNDFVLHEFENHPNVEELTRQYEREMKSFLDDIARDADRRIEREKRNQQKPRPDINDLLTDEEKEHIEKLNRAAADLIALSEVDAERGDLTFSEQRTALALEAKASAEAIRERRMQAYKLREEEGAICEICGNRMEIGMDQTEKDGRPPGGCLRFAPHELGKMHRGYIMVRAKIQEIEEKEQVYREKKQGGSDCRNGLKERSRRGKPSEHSDEPKERREEKEKEVKLKEKKGGTDDGLEAIDDKGARKEEGPRKADVVARHHSRPSHSHQHVTREWHRSRSRLRRNLSSSMEKSRRPRSYGRRR